MDIVSKIVRDQKQVEIIFNEDKKLFLSWRIFRAHRLQEGETLDLRAYLPRIAEAQRKEALQKAISLIAVKDRSTGEIREALSRRKYGKSVIEHVIQRLEQEGLLSDSNFALAFAKAKMSQGFGKQRIVQGLLKKGLPAHVAQQALDALHYEEEALIHARRLAEKYAKRYEALDFSTRQRIKMALLRKGYSTDIAVHAVDRME